MIQFFGEYYQEFANAPSWISITAQSISAILVAAALIIAWYNLRGLKRSQAVQSQMNLINLENEVRNNQIQLKVSNYKYIEATTVRSSPSLLSFLYLEKSHALELYLSSADKLAALIGSKFFNKQFKGRDWKLEYLEIFRMAKHYHQTENVNLIGKDQMIRNINSLIAEWDRPRN